MLGVSGKRKSRPRAVSLFKKVLSPKLPSVTVQRSAFSCTQRNSAEVTLTGARDDGSDSRTGCMAALRS